MEDSMQFLPSLQDMATQEYPAANWINFYLNVWQKNVIARTVDVAVDAKLKAENPDMPVEWKDVNGMPAAIAVKYRLEHRKAALENALSIVDGLKGLKAMTNEQLTQTYWSAEALKVADDVAAESANFQDYVTLADVTLPGQEAVTPKGTTVSLDSNAPDIQELITNNQVQLASQAGNGGADQEQQQEQQEAAPAEEQQQEAAPAEEQQQEAAPDNFVEYTVANGEALTAEGHSFTNGDKVKLDPEAEGTKDWISKGYITAEAQQ